MSAGKNILLVVMGILLVLAVFVSSTLLTANTLLYPEVYIESLEDNRVYEYFDNFTGGVPGGEFVDVPESGIKIVVDGALVNFLSYTRGDSEKLDLTLKIEGSSAKDFLVSQVENFPECDSEKILSEGPEEVCIPAGTDPSEFVDEIFEENNITLESTSIDLVEVSGLDVSGVERVRENVELYRMILYAILFFSFALIGLIFFAASDPKVGLMVTGISLFVGGAFVTISSLVTRSFLSSISLGIEILKNVVVSLAETLLSRHMTYGFVLIGLGAVTFGASFFVAKIKNSLDKPKKV